MATAKLRILHVAEAFGSGVYEAIRLISNHAAAEGYEVHVAYGLRLITPPAFETQFDPAVEFHQLPWGQSRDIRTLLSATAALRRVLVSRQWDLVHLHSTFAGIAGTLVTPRGTPIVYTPHGYSFLMDTLSRRERLASTAIERVVARRVSVLGAVSESEAAQARRVGARRVAVVENGIAELDDFPISGGEVLALDGRDGVVAAGRMSAQRQPRAVAEIFSRLGDATPTRWLGGGNDDGLTGVVSASGAEVTGWLSRDDLLSGLRQAYVYLHWTAWDGSPLTVLEAMSQGAVVIGSDIPPVREILGSAQVLDSEVDAARLIAELLDDRPRLEELQRQQHRRASKYSARSMTEQWLSLYSELLAR